MSDENKNKFCKCNELADRLRASLKDNERLAKTIRDLGQENYDMPTHTRNRPSGFNDHAGYKEKFEVLVEINQGWKKDYEKLQMRNEMLSGEKRLLHHQERKLKERINELEKRQKALEGQIAKLAAPFNAQKASDGRASPLEEQCELLKSQVFFYKEGFERERHDRENLNKEKEKYKRKLEDAEEIIKKLTAELDGWKAFEQVRRQRGHYSENGYSSERRGIPRHQLQLLNPFREMNERWQMEQHTLENCIPDCLTQGDNMGHYLGAFS